MKGLDLSKQFFFDWGLPYLNLHFPQLKGRVAAGLCGGSDSLHADDEISRDHDWGPRFELWLTDDDYGNHGKELDENINHAAPSVFLSIERSKRARAVRVASIDGWFKEETGFTHPPKGVGAWEFSPITESHLHFIKHAPIYYDPLGEFSTRKEEFSHFAPEMLLYRMTGCCWCLWHFGEYNFCSRVSKRDDLLTRHLCVHHFVESAMRMCLYLNEDFCPYWKWLPFQFRKTPMGQQIRGQLDVLVGTSSMDEKVSAVQSVCRVFRQELYARGLISGTDVPELGSGEISQQRRRLMDGKSQ